jgi:hypothetical protein
MNKKYETLVPGREIWVKVGPLYGNATADLKEEIAKAWLKAEADCYPCG